jgi:hypothetical protein
MKRIAVSKESPLFSNDTLFFDLEENEYDQFLKVVQEHNYFITLLGGNRKK